MTLEQWIQLFGFIITIIVLAVKTSRDIDNKVEEAKVLCTAELAKAKDDGDAKRGRMYERMDMIKKAYDEKIDAFRKVYEDRHEQLKKDISDEFVQVKICKILHDTSSKEMSEIKSDVKLIYEELRKLNEKLVDGKKG